MIFSQPVDGTGTRKLRQGAVTLGGRRWIHPGFAEIPVDTSLELLRPLRKSTDRLFVRHNGKDIGWAEPMPTFAHGDRDGARYQAGLEKAQVTAVRKLTKDVDPTVTIFDTQKSNIQQRAPVTIPPQSWKITAIDKTVGGTTVEEAEAKAEADARSICDDIRSQRAARRRRAAGLT